MRAWLSDPGTDTQALFGGSSLWRGRYRSGGTFDLETSGGNLRRPMLLSGWYSVLVTQSPGGVTLEVSGSAGTSGPNSALGISSLQVGAASGASDSGNWSGLVSRIVP